MFFKQRAFSRQIKTGGEESSTRAFVENLSLCSFHALG